MRLDYECEIESTSTIFDFQSVAVSGALVLHAGFRQRG